MALTIKPPIELSKKQQTRFEAFCPNGIPKKIRCYDNNGETEDRYTIVFTGSYKSKTGGQHWYLGASGQPFHPLGIGQHGASDTQIDYPTYGHLGKKIKFETLPDDVQQFVIQNYLYLWDFTNEYGDWISGFKKDTIFPEPVINMVNGVIGNPPIISK